MEQRDKRINHRLIAHIEKDRVEEVINMYMGNSKLLDETLRKVIVEDLAASDERVDDPEFFDKPNLPERNAWHSGYRYALRYVLSLLP